MRPATSTILLTLGFAVSAAEACEQCRLIDGRWREPSHLHFSSETSETSLTAGGSGTLLVPPLSSRPQARAKLFLDFDGDFTPVWVQYSPGVTPAYSIDADTSTFSSSELANIFKIWSGVAEKYSPFNIDVTTIDPGPLVKRESFRVVIGGNGTWFSPTPTAAGVAYIGSFYNTQPTSTAYVFSALLLPNDPLHTSFVTAATAHEAGHGFGLQHQSVWSETGQLLDPYNRGDEHKAPIMGSSYRKRGLWWEGTSLGPQTIQRDLTVLSGSNNGFGYRPDDHANTPELATPLNILGDNAYGSGVIERNSDFDYFSFETLAGQISFTLNVAPHDAMLDGSLALFNLAGDTLQWLDTPTLGESFTMEVPAGSYRLAVFSHGFYGDVGQYSILGTIVPVPDPAFAGPLGLAGLLSWSLARRKVPKANRFR
ncbi:MAG: hypothetical protein NZ561_04775 [Phycisphaerae bacterium]|nr:hypothetical protein [Phycisphaerae bacterium]